MKDGSLDLRMLKCFLSNEVALFIILAVGVLWRAGGTDELVAQMHSTQTLEITEYSLIQ